jgi:asparagine synthetase B (glutamine-hydrolysing)
MLSPIALAVCETAAALSSPLPPVNLDRGIFDEGNVQAFARVLTLAVARRASMFANGTAILAVAVLFSGGVDSTVLALLLHRVLPPQYSIDLINVAFENARRADFDDQHAFDVPDRLTGTAALGDLQRLAPERDWRFVAVDVKRDELEAER